MFEKPALPGVSKKKHRKKSPEERSLIIAIRNQQRPIMTALFLEAEPDKDPTEQVESALDLVIQELYKNGKMKEMLDDLLKEKIEEEQKKAFGSTYKPS